MQSAKYGYAVLQEMMQLNIAQWQQQRVRPRYRGSESPHWVPPSVNTDKGHNSQAWLGASSSYGTRNGNIAVMTCFCLLVTAVVTATLQL
jgi:hypothetical protein